MLTRAALKNPVSVLMIAVVLAVLGWISLRRIPVDLFPEITVPIAVVGVVYPGAGPRDVEASLVIPLERALASVPNATHIESTARQGMAILRVYFDWGADINTGATDCIQKVQQIMSALPPGTQPPFVVKLDLSNMAVIGLTLSGENMDDRELYELAYHTVLPQLERIPGVATVNISGGRVRQVNVLADRDALAARNLSCSDLTAAIAQANFLMPSGSLTVGDVEYNLFTDTQIDDVRRFEELPVKVGSDAEAAVLLRDVASVEDGGERLTNLVRVNGKRGVNLWVRKQPGANTVEVVDRVHAAIPRLRGIPQGVAVAPTFDQSQYIRASIDSLANEALMGAVLAILVIFLFLRSFRATLVIALSIPLSLLATFMLLFFIGRQSLNTFTLGGLALGVGRLVDDSIVVLENIFRHRARGEAPAPAAMAGAREVAMPVLASTIATMVVFLPVVFLSGIAKLLFIPLTLAIVFALAASYFVSMTVIPALSVRLMTAQGSASAPAGALARIRERWRRVFDGLESGYRALLRRMLRHRALAATGILVACAAPFLWLPRIGSAFFPETDESQIVAILRAPVGQRVERTNAELLELQSVVRKALGPENIVALVSDAGVRQSGGGAIFGGNTGPHTGTLRIQLVPPERRPFGIEEAIGRIRKVAGDRFAGRRLLLDAGGLVRRLLSFGSESPIDVEILGQDFEAARRLSSQVMAVVENTPGAADVRVSREEDYPEIDIQVDREKAGLLGLTTRDIAQGVLTSMAGNLNQPSVYSDPVTGKEYHVVVLLREQDRTSLSDLEGVPLSTRAGRVVELRTVAQVVPAAGPVQVDRKYQQRIVHVTANVVGRPLGDVAAEIERQLDDLARPAGFEIRLGGQREQQQESFRGLLLALGLALLLAYAAMATQFGSLLDPLIVMFSVPLGIAGVVAILALTKTPLSIMAYMGIIMMVGIVLSNGILLLEFANVQMRMGRDRFEAVVEAGAVRLRPILMTTLTTLLGLLPMAIGIGEGSESNVPLARAVVGGLSVSTLLTLVLIPILITVLRRRVRRDPLADEDRIENA
jgi:hydrophobe/amphiphile efflux-1 (HAE1) family protein